VPPEPISRRAFLAASGGLVTATAAAGLVGWAPRVGAQRSKELSPLVVSNDLFASPEPQRFAFTIYRGPRPAAGPPARLAIAPPGTNEAPIVETALDRTGLPKGRGVYYTDVVFPEEGVYDAVVLTRGKKVPFALQVNATPEGPAIGAAAPRAASPTPDDTLGVKPICTRDPTCPLHTVSLADVVGTGRPVAVLFATPALCQTRYCGPVLDELLEVMPTYQDRVTFVHVEIYKSNRGTKRVPTVVDWNLPFEPWLVTIDGAGIINGRLDSAFGHDEITRTLDALVA
jgi:hypothetical protein